MLFSVRVNNSIGFESFSLSNSLFGIQVISQSKFKFTCLYRVFQSLNHHALLRRAIYDCAPLVLPRGHIRAKGRQAALLQA